MRKIIGYKLMPCLALALPVLLISSITACSSNATSEDILAKTPSNPLSNSMSLESNYQPTPGPYSVGIADDISLRTSGDRDLPLKVYYPQGKGPFPVIIFSHGTGASKEAYSELGSYWASYGYVSIHPTHADSLSLRGESGDRGNLREIISSMLQDSQGWIDRAKDISLIINSLDKLQQQVPELKGKIDVQRLGVGGHSYGAYTAQLIGGATIDLPGASKPESFADKRAKAILLLSPQGTGQQGLTPTSWEGFNKPMMVMTGSEDRGAQGQGPDWKEEPFKLSPPGNKYLVFIEGANHFSFSGRMAGGNGMGRFGGGFLGGNRRFGRRWREGGGTGMALGQDQTVIFDYVKMATLAFWDAYLKGENQAKTYLKSEALPDYSQGNVSITRR
jgi:predicted dienelactone hydrolase